MLNILMLFVTLYIPKFPGLPGIFYTHWECFYIHREAATKNVRNCEELNQTKAEKTVNCEHCLFVKCFYLHFLYCFHHPCSICCRVCFHRFHYLSIESVLKQENHLVLCSAKTGGRCVLLFCSVCFCHWQSYCLEVDALKPLDNNNNDCQTKPIFNSLSCQTHTFLLMTFMFAHCLSSEIDFYHFCGLTTIKRRDIFTTLFKEVSFLMPDNFHTIFNGNPGCRKNMGLVWKSRQMWFAADCNFPQRLSDTDNYNQI